MAGNFLGRARWSEKLYCLPFIYIFIYISVCVVYTAKKYIYCGAGGSHEMFWMEKRTTNGQVIISTYITYVTR